jgi:hypothetical protein
MDGADRGVEPCGQLGGGPPTAQLKERQERDEPLCAHEIENMPGAGWKCA